MADIIIKIIQPASSFDLLTLQELKLGLDITDATQDAALTELIHRYSDYVAEMCNRVFAKEKLSETWRELGCRRIFLSHWPVAQADIESVECPRGTIIDPVNWELEEGSGKVEIFTSRPEPIVVTYTGGFDLPTAAPYALKQACQILIRDERATAQQAAAAGIRSISHRESRVMFFDPNQASRGGGAATGGSARIDAMRSLLMQYTRIQV